MRFRLRTLMIVLALGPPIIWAVWEFSPQTKPEPLPAPYQAMDDVQYFAPGPDFTYRCEGVTLVGASIVRFAIARSPAAALAIFRTSCQMDGIDLQNAAVIEGDEHEALGEPLAKWP